MNIDESINNLIKSFSNEICFDFSYIKRIHVVTHDEINEWYGTVNSLDINDSLCFELLLRSNILTELCSENATENQRAKSIIMHELYHCKEMKITSQLLGNWKNVYFHPPITTTKLLFLDTAFHQWSEYYAYYNSSKIHGRDIKFSPSCVNGVAEAFNQVIRSKTLSDIQIPESMHNDFIAFIHTCVKLVAHYNSTHDRKYAREINRCMTNSYNQYYYPYLKDLAYYMDNLYLTYPNWISEEAFIELGNKLYSFLKLHNLWFSSQDLSDNFYLKRIE